MGARRALVVTAAVTAVLGVAALVTGEAWIAALCGLGAIAVASLAVRARLPSPVVSERPEPEPDQCDGGALDVEPVPVVRGGLDELVLDAMLRNRVAVARRTLQPLSVIHVDVGDSLADPANDASVADVFEEILRESDVFGQRSDGIYVFVLADTDEDGAVWTAERLRRGFVDAHAGRSFFAGIACYPSHSLEADVVDAKAANALDAAREWHLDRIEVALG